MTLTKVLAAAVFLALTGTVLLDVRWVRQRKIGLAVGITCGFLVFAASLYTILMEFITRT